MIELFLINNLINKKEEKNEKFKVILSEAFTFRSISNRQINAYKEAYNQKNKYYIYSTVNIMLTAIITLISLYLFINCYNQRNLILGHYFRFSDFIEFLISLCYPLIYIIYRLIFNKHNGHCLPFN